MTQSGDSIATVTMPQVNHRPLVGPLRDSTMSLPLMLSFLCLGALGAMTIQTHSRGHRPSERVLSDSFEGEPQFSLSRRHIMSIIKSFTASSVCISASA